MSLLETTELVAGYGAIRVLHGVSVTVAPQSITALVGANGAGKTTLLRAIAGLIPVTSGSVRWRGVAIHSQSTAQRVEAGIALVPEGRLVFPTFSVAENLKLGAVVPRARAGSSRRIDAMYALFPRLAERRRQSAGSLSGGEQQMLAIARALMAEPSLLLLDEPTLGLAPIVAKQVFEIVARLRAEGLTILIAEQDVRRTLALADTAYVVENGRITLAGEAKTLLQHAGIRGAFLGV